MKCESCLTIDQFLERKWFFNQSFFLSFDKILLEMGFSNLNLFEKTFVK